ncbi:MAG: hypothetical protein ACREEM_27640 [Blastocatellia bacterium]
MKELLLSIVIAALLPPVVTTGSGRTQVFVVSTLYSRHESVPAYDLATLRKVILAIEPDVFVLDVTPDELKNEKVWPGKVEYPGVIFPLMKELKVRAYGSEPKEPLFSELSGAATRAHNQLEQTSPQAFQAIGRHKQATYDGLKIIWKSPADVNSAVTDTIIAGMTALEEQIVGEAAISGQRRWDQHHVERILDAAKQNPGKRLLVLVGIQSRYSIINQLKRNSRIDLVEMESWLRKNYRP